MEVPILYSFRRCPYAIRARLALDVAGMKVEHREVLLRDKPEEMIEASPKGTVPVLVLPSERTVLEESLDIMLFALEAHDPEDWLANRQGSLQLIDEVDTVFKPHLDGYKYGSRLERDEEQFHKDQGVEFLKRLDGRIEEFVNGSQFCLADAAIAPFVRQFANHDRAFFDALPFPSLQAWLDAFLKSERFLRVMVKRPQWTSELQQEVGLSDGLSTEGLIDDSLSGISR